MYDDVVEFRDFYATSLGQVAARMLRRSMRIMWPDLHGLSLLGLGYATPLLRPFREECARTIACMPASQGVVPWPAGEANLVTLADESELPFADASIDRLVMVHALEHSEQVRPLLREAWRILAGNGRLLVIVPNRRGIWARLDRTPFGSGSPFTPGQLSRLLRDSLFTPLQSTTALYVPPSRSRMMLSAAPAWEQLGSRWFPSFAGAVLLEASKEIYAAPTERRSPRERHKLLPAALIPGPRA